jgi:hypothetical protein
MLQLYFTTKLCNFTNYGILFNDVVVIFAIQSFFFISYMESVRYSLNSTD